MSKVSNKRIPANIQKLVWSKPTSLDIETDKTVIIHHVLRYGTLEDISTLMKLYPKQEIVKIFVNQPVNIYSKSSYNFAKNTVLQIKESLENESRYIQTFY